MEFDVNIGSVMRRDFPIVNVSEKLTDCATLLGDGDVCLVEEDGKFRGILSQEEILEGFLNGDEYIERLRNNVGIIESQKNISDLITLMRKDETDFVVVKENRSIVGVITRRELLNIEPFLFEGIERTKSSINQTYLIN